MKILYKKVYYCEFCSKHRLASGVIKEHEKHCTGNPNRECKMCEDGPLTFEIKESQPYDNSDFTEKTIEVNKNDCPACVLAFIRQNKITNVNIKGESGYWQYKEQCEKWWAEKNAEASEEDRYSI